MQVKVGCTRQSQRTAKPTAFKAFARSFKPQNRWLFEVSPIVLGKPFRQNSPVLKDFIGERRCFSISKETKIRIPLWIYPSTENELNELYERDNCKSASEFIEKAIKFYIGYIKHKNNINYLTPIITDTVNGIVLGSERRMNRNLFKIAVELGKLSHMMAAVNDIDEETLRDLHAMCVNEVRHINGTIDFESAVEYQKE